MEVLYWRSDGQLIFELYRGTQQQIVSSFKVLSYRWNHVAVTRQADIIRLFINGRLSGQETIQNGFISNRNLRLGNDYEGNSFIGYMNELRLTKNVFRYVDNFISSIIKFDESDPHFSNVSLLLHFEGNLFQNTFQDSSSSPKTIVRSGSIFIEQKESVFGTTSAFFSGRGSIENIRIYNKGYNYDITPLLIINSKHGSGAVLLAQSDTIGQIKTIETINPFIDTDKDLVSVSIETDTGTGAQVSPIRSTVFKEKLNFKSFEGFLGLNTTLLDSHYFQQFSYQTECELSRNQFDSVVNQFVHPVGFIRFSLLKLNNHKQIHFMTTFETIFIIKRYEMEMSSRYLFNPIFNLHWLKEMEQYTNWVSGFDWIKEEETYEDAIYFSDAIPSYLIKYMVFFNDSMLVNTPPNFEWFKNSDLFNFSNEYWEDLSPEGIQNLNYLNEALDASVSLVV